jgi:DNA (cytosine-5)-methyltransferase 1
VAQSGRPAVERVAGEFSGPQGAQSGWGGDGHWGGGATGGLADAVQPGRTEWGTVAGDRSVARSGGADRLADADCDRLERQDITSNGQSGTAGDSEAREPSAVNGFWRASDWLFCRDNRWRPVEPGTFPLAYGAQSRVGRLRAYGNAICIPQAVEFIKAFMET